MPDEERANEPAVPRAKGYGVKLVRGPFVRLPSHELACEDGDSFLALAGSYDKPLVADLFCGAGGLSLGLKQAGCEVVLAVDNDEEALETHRAHHPGLSVNWDLHDPEVVHRVGHMVRDAGITVVAGGPPCQPFSRAGRSMMRDLVRRGIRDRHDRRRDLWESFLQIIEIAEPPAVVMENVPDMALDRGMVILRTMIERLERLGYSVEERVIDTARYGVPQFRHRLILVALADGMDFEWPTEAEDRVTLDNAISDLPEVQGGWRPSNGDGVDPVASGWQAYGGPRTEFQFRARQGVEAEHAGRIYDHITRPVREDDRIAFAAMDHTTRYSDLAPELKRYRDDIFDDKYKRLDGNDVSRTITAHIAKDGYWYIHPYQDRTLTVREAARLQTFPDWFRFAGPPSAAFRQIGNAVPVELGRTLGVALLKSMEQKAQASVGTRQISEELAIWFQATEPRYVPWLAATDRWVVVQGELLWSRLQDDRLRTAWAAIRRCTTPERTVRALPTLRLIAKVWGREDRVDQLEETARWFLDDPDRAEALTPALGAPELIMAPHLSQAAADLACRVVPGETEDPVLSGFGVLRVAARFQGDDVDRKNRQTDGRLAIARMIGGEDRSHAAHLALIELAGGICGPGTPRCGECPLQDWCAEAKSRPVQPTLGFTNPDRRLERGPNVATDR